ncbi:MAG: hypothetical protein J7M18_07540, partial [Candidatus Eremiobacteraeota bacterium]|nr:hypothetical protein [Candidatus Eremiobacteraeota bacterium]
VIYLFLGVLLFYLIRLYFNFIRDNLFRLLGLILAGGFFFMIIKLAKDSVKFSPVPDKQLFFWSFTFLTFIAGFVLWVIMTNYFKYVQKIGKANSKKFRPIQNFMTAMTITFVLSAWLYFNPNFVFLNGFLLEKTADLSEINLPWPYFEFYPKRLLETALRWGYLPFLLIGIVTFLFKLEKKPSREILLIMLLTSALLLSIVPNKQDRFLLPWLVLVAPVAVCWIDYLGKFKFLPVILLLFIGFSYSFCGWALPPDFYSNNKFLTFIIRGDSPLSQRKEKIKINDRFFNTIFSPLPDKKVKILIPGNIFYPVGKHIFYLYAHLSSKNIDFSIQPALENYHYVLYSQPINESENYIYTRIKTVTPYKNDVEKFKFPLVSRYPVAEMGFEIKLCKVIKKNNFNISPENYP